MSAPAAATTVWKDNFFRREDNWSRDSSKGRLYYVKDSKTKEKVAAMIMRSSKSCFSLVDTSLFYDLVPLDGIKEMPGVDPKNVILGRMEVNWDGRLFPNCLYIENVDNFTGKPDFLLQATLASGKDKMKVEECLYSNVGKIFMAFAVELSKEKGDKPIVVLPVGNAPAFWVQCGMLPMTELPNEETKGHLKSLEDQKTTATSAQIATIVVEEKKRGRKVPPNVNFELLAMQLPKAAYEQWKADLEL